MQSAEEISQKTIDLLEHLHSIVIGPGLGRDNLMQDTAAKIIEAAKARNMPMVVDAVWHPPAHPPQSRMDRGILMVMMIITGRAILGAKPTVYH